nr:hypothetical protein [Malikia spinosa]
MTASKIESAKKMLASGMPPREMAQNRGGAMPTLYRWLRPLARIGQVQTGTPAEADLVL